MEGKEWEGKTVRRPGAEWGGAHVLAALPDAVSDKATVGAPEPRGHLSASMPQRHVLKQHLFTQVPQSFVSYSLLSAEAFTYFLPSFPLSRWVQACALFSLPLGRCDQGFSIAASIKVCCFFISVS